MTLTKEKRAELRRVAEAYAADSRSSVFGPKTMLSVLDELDAAERKLAEAWSDGAVQSWAAADGGTFCVDEVLVDNPYAKGSTP